MKKIEYLINGISETERTVFSDMITYISEYIYSVKKEKNKVTLEIQDDKENEVLGEIEKLKKMLELDEVKNSTEIKTKILSDYRDRQVINGENVYDDLLKNGDVMKMSDGVYAYSGLFLRIYRYFCRKIDDFGRKNFKGIREIEDSVLYPVAEYEKGHYFESFPHHIMFQTNIKSDSDVLDEFSKKGAGSLGVFSNNNMKRPDNVIRHAACVPIYPLLSDKLIDADNPAYFLVSGKCFRNEAANVTELARLNEFYMKEFVCIGTYEQSLDMIKKARELWEMWIDTFNLNCTVETANDSFFANNYKKLKIFQILGDSKQELRVLIPHNDTYCSVSSSNVHRTHFTKTYNIHNSNSYCQSSCFAFGIERLTYCLLSQKGLDIEKWDDKSRQEVFG